MNVTRLPIRLSGDDRRVIVRPFLMGASRVKTVLDRVSELPEGELEGLLANVYKDYGSRHKELPKTLEENFHTAAGLIGFRDDWSHQRRLLAGSYFTMEYSIDSAALFNPSIVPHPDQTGVADGATRFVMSLRATGEGHVSSVVFRTGTINRDGSVTIDPQPTMIHRARLAPDRIYEKALFRRKLSEVGCHEKVADTVLGYVGDNFSMQHLADAVEKSHRQVLNIGGSRDAMKTMQWLASSNYTIKLAADAPLSELVIFPMSDDESRGIEDLRLVRFVEDDGSIHYYGTYTAYNGVRTLPMMIHTRDFHRIEVHSLNGPGAANKGIALFPRKINGKYVVCSRIDGENLYIAESESPYFWGDSRRLITPKFPWEIMQIGNCGSPIETEAGWLLLTHGVGPVRTYAIGAMLLDLNDPYKVIGHLREPLITPLANEREGYVPNVVYTCGAMIHAGQLYVPFALADKATSLAVVDVKELLDQLTAG